MVTLTINGNQITASPERTILQVCREQRLDDIPTLCYDEKLPPFGSCFLCVVEVDDQSRLFPSCSTKVAEGMNILTRSEKVKRSRKTCLELLLSDHFADCFGPCRLNCPADVDIQGYMSLIHLGKFREAIALIKEKNPLPSVCGRVCTRKCEINCRRAIVDSPVGIDFLKRYAADQDMIGEMWQPEMKPDNGHRVAIVGGGPAGLTCAYYLCIEGYRPTIFESLPKLGGMLRYGIPEYRLPKDVLDKELDWITALGVEVRTNASLGKDFTLDSLFDDGFKSVFVGLGAQTAKKMRVDNEEVAGVLGGVDFLRKVELGINPKLHGRVVVVGGGNTAIDAARTSLRLGVDEVILLYRRTRKEMPANEIEIEAMEEEGVKTNYLAAPVKVNSENGRMVSLDCIRMELGEPDSSGRRRPVRIEGSEYTLEADWVISAIGQEPDLDGIDDDGRIQTTDWKTIEANEKTFDTDRAGVFAGGDVVTGPADAIDAIAAGRMAARAIDKYISTSKVEPFVDRFESRRDNLQKITADDLDQIGISARHAMPEMAATERIKSFAEVETGYTEENAISEAARCAECGCDVGLSCRLQDYCTEYGVDQTRFQGAFNRYKVDTRHPFIKIDSNKCIRCGRCVATCSEILNVSALGFVNRGFKTIVKPAMEKALHETNCVSCGNCIDVCPTGALSEKMAFRRSGPWKMESHFNICNYCSVGCNITLNVKTPDIFFVTGAPIECEPNNGELCVRGRFGYQHYLDGSRATKPMIRKQGELKEVSWQEAFDEIGRRFGELSSTSTPKQILLSASPKLTTEELYLTGRLGRDIIGTNNLVSFHKETNGADYHALDAMLGRTASTVTMEDALKADLYLFVGGNPTEENPVLGWKLKRRMRHGTPAIVLNSTEIDLTRYAEVWADPRRGTMSLLLSDIAAELIKSGKIDRSFIETKTANFDQVSQALSRYGAVEDASITGVRPEQIKDIVDILGDPNRKVVAFYNLDSQIERSPSDLKALATLMMLTGKIGTDGSGLALLSSQCNLSGMELAGFDSEYLPGGVPTTNLAQRHQLSVLWQTKLDGVVNGNTIHADIDGTTEDIRAALVIGENPAADTDLRKLMDRLEFLVVADMFLTETAKMADVFLPMSSYLESQGHFVNWAGKKQDLAPIGEPISGLTNIELIQKLASCLGRSMPYASIDEISSELDFLIQRAGSSAPKGSHFQTTDGKATFVVYSPQVSPTRIDRTPVLEIDNRISARMKSISG